MSVVCETCDNNPLSELRSGQKGLYPVLTEMSKKRRQEKVRFRSYLDMAGSKLTGVKQYGRMPVGSPADISLECIRCLYRL